MKYTINKMKATVNPIPQKSNKLIFMLLMTIVLIVPYKSMAKTGQEIYKELCAACHTLTDKRLVGPGFAGVTERRSEDWLISWIKDSQAMVKAGDKDAVAIFEEYNKTPMPGYASQLSDDEIKDLLKFLAEDHTVVAATTATSGASPTTVEPKKSEPLSIYTIGAIIVLILLGFWLYKLRESTNKQMRDLGFHSEPHEIPNYSLHLLIYISIASILIYFLIEALTLKSGMIDTIMFIAFPYFSLGIFLIGSIYRYLNRGFQVSSLSSQFLEGRKLFWGSLPFHWGLFVLFFGHLIAFLFPSSVMAWNGHPVRLLILELSSFAFGLGALLGLILLIKRRLASRKLLVVANKMDMVVYTVLLTQIVSGLGVAFFVRWGSSWFASVLTPYLRSIFSFNPDISAVVEMPIWVQIHIISAFSIVAIIPFTRFVHFLVAPFDYAWRKYQIVIWNWNPKYIRMSRKWNYGKKAKNH
ncbi:MAG: respiratory nitrate reductase subunit gamma [Bacteroidia bacterium]|nr:respiratory nitrate reductase subunit gamma [Bacteroidia bacterium]MCZ2249587.1 respiratory nitrate reductase subunit gamma [Bacteroidia bacterium]